MYEPNQKLPPIFLKIFYQKCLAADVMHENTHVKCKCIFPSYIPRRVILPMILDSSACSIARKVYVVYIEERETIVFVLVCFPGHNL